MRNNSVHRHLYSVIELLVNEKAVVRNVQGLVLSRAFDTHVVKFNAPAMDYLTGSVIDCSKRHSVLHGRDAKCLTLISRQGNDVGGSKKPYAYICYRPSSAI